MDWGKRIDWKEFDFADVPDEKDYPDAGAVILLDEGKMEILTTSQLPLSIFERHRIVKIMNPRGHRYAFVTIPYSSQSRVENIQARTIAPDGKIYLLNKKNIYDVNLYPGFIFYSDQRAKIFTLPAVEDGSIVEYRYIVQMQSHSLWPAWNFQDYAPIIKSKFTISAPSEWELNHKLYRIDLESSVTKAPSGFKSTYSWEKSNAPAFKTEFGMPSINDCIARLEVAPVGIKTWDDVASWYHELAEPQTKAGRGVKAKALELTAGLDNNYDKLKTIYEWVRDQIRYVAIEIGIGGFQPYPAEEILLNRYGDCKDIATLICSLAREVGIDAYHVLVSTWQNGMPDTSLPSPLQFNHAIAYCPDVGENGTWMDGTDKGAPFGRLPWYDQGLPTLVVGKEGKGEIIFTPRNPADSNQTIFQWNVHLDANGAATVQGETRYKGANASEMRGMLYYASSENRKNWLETFLAARCPGAILDSFTIAGLNPTQDSLTITYLFQTPIFSIPYDSEMTLRPGQILAFDLPDYFRSSTRNHPIQFRFGTKSKLNLMINIPDEWEMKTSVSSDSLTSQFGSATWDHSIHDKKLNIRIKSQLNGATIQPGQYRAFQNFIDQIKARDLREIVLQTKK